ncbi:DRB0094 family RNA ligase [Apiospora hydei]|uniref:DRB0094 family RNA ligase n=1 Tax=Apiospora hydei TaxID=1337664 RepID=A0ABR1WZ80_9PEZI
MTRKLVSVRQVSHLEPLVSSASLLLADVDGWKCVMKKGTAEVGDHVVYFEIDSFLPAAEDRFASLGQLNTYNGKLATRDGRFGFHVKSIKHDGVLSQGFIMPLDRFPEITSVIAELRENNTHEEAMQKVMGMNFEDKLNVFKMEPAAAARIQPSENSFGPCPSFFPKTDIKRVQNCPNLFTAKYKDAVYQETVKMNGCAETVYFICRDSPLYATLPPLEGRADMPEGRIGVCTRKRDLTDKPGCLFWGAAIYYELPEKLAALGKSLAIQGELCGSTICQNREGFPEGKHDFYVYRIFDIDAQEALGPVETEEMAEKLELRHVPVNSYCRLHDIAASNADLLQRAEGVGSLWKAAGGSCVQEREGRSQFQGDLQRIPRWKRGVEVEVGRASNRPLLCK